KNAAAKELSIRAFLEEHSILTVPDWLQHYTLRAMPDYLRALQGFGETDDFTSPSRLNANCVRYVTEPKTNTAYFWRATAMDPRPICVHAGIPGQFTLDEAAKYLHDKVPMDIETARQEAVAFSTGPGGAISYQIGKLQIVKMLADARLKDGAFTLRKFHDFVWKNGNVPISLQR